MFLISTENSKRTEFMIKAAKTEHIPVELLTWGTLQPAWKAEQLLAEKLPMHRSTAKTILPGQLHGAAVKIDPPHPQVWHLDQMNGILKDYKILLNMLSKTECCFLNTPEAICRLLDKRNSKIILQEKGVPVTEMFSENISGIEQLLECMARRRCYSVFIKPRCFSGAAGVAAFRHQPKQGRFCLYTSCRLEKKQLINTKKLYRLEDRLEIFSLLDRLLALDCIVERWHPKASFHGKSYDLRVVFQFGHIAYMVARQSTGPITNLHLNNQVLPVQSLELPQDTMQSIKNICQTAVSAFDGLSMAGVDILLEHGTGRPLIIEMNGQGDLIYQDIYGENKIYREQAKWMCSRETPRRTES